jgi:hypothetical protein
MSSQIDGHFRTFGFSTAISAYRLVIPSTTTAGFADVATTGTVRAIGVVQQDVAAGDAGTVKLFHPTFFATVSGTAAVGDVVKFDNGGQVTTQVANIGTAGIALEAATATSAVIEIAVPLY